MSDRFSVLIVSNEGHGPDEVMLFPSSGDWEADSQAMSAYAKAHGYREEYEDYWLFTGERVCAPSLLTDRSQAGRYAQD